MQAIGNLREKLRTTHGRSYAQVSVVAVDLDKDLNAGFEFLSKMGDVNVERAFDQIIVGGSWLNEQMVRLVWREGISEAASPQILLIERPINTEAYVSSATISVESDRLIAQLSGNEIIPWIKRGIPLSKSAGPEVI